MDTSHQSLPTAFNYQHQMVVVMVPFPAQGHLNQLLHLSRLIISHNIPVHYVGAATHNLQAIVRVQGWDPNSISNMIHFHNFKPYLPLSFVLSSHIRKPVAELVKSLSSVARRVVVIHDSLMASVVQDTRNMSNVEESYTFHCTCAFTVSSFFWGPMGKPLPKSPLFPQVPSLEGCLTTHIKDFIDKQGEFLRFSDGNIYNTTRAIESPHLEFMEGIPGSKKHWAVGPFNPLTIEKKDSKGGRQCMEWLDKQEPNSVIYVSFGTTTTLTEDQIEQIAIGFEQSKKKFIWVLRDSDKDATFNGNGNEGKRLELPNGFEERVEGIGLVVRDWAPKLEILSHDSTGGFMSHCGWNSCLESISMGVPIAAWPMHSDQPRNSVLIEKILKVGLVVKDWSQVTASEIENSVRRLMETKEGDKMRERAMDLKNVIHGFMDEGGVSRMEMDSFIAHITE